MTIYTLMPLHEALGLAVIGVDLGAPIDDETRVNLSRLLAEHLVLLFPDQSLSPEQYLTAAAAFGAPMPQEWARDPMPRYPNIGLVGRRKDQPAPDTWHTDHLHLERPPAATLFYALEIPPSGGGTSIANMRAAYWALSEEERRHIETLRTVNGHHSARTTTGAEHPAIVTHPMVRTHPISRERAVYFHPTETMYIEGMTQQESKEYLAALVERMIEPDIVYHHHWVKGDVLVIDDHATWYRAHDDYGGGENRVWWKINITGERPTLAGPGLCDFA
jgi:taurine dioxygenase